MTRTLAGVLAMSAIATASLDAQGFGVRLGGHGVYLSHQEIAEGRSASGLGFGGELRIQLSRIAIEGEGAMVSSLTPDSAGLAAFDLTYGDARLSVLVARPFSIEVGAGGWTVEPAFAAQDVGYLKAGVLVESPLTRLGDIALRGAYLVPKFSGGGDAGFGFEVGVKTMIGTPNGRFRFGGGYEFKRFDRSITAPGATEETDLPIQFTAARFGLEIRF
ncbi:MAG TPA: hypothetical protein VGA37_05165 [Gemmatimonadales bacterium]